MIYNRTAKIKNTVHKRQNNGKCASTIEVSHKIFGKVKGDGAGDEIELTTFSLATNALPLSYARMLQTIRGARDNTQLLLTLQVLVENSAKTFLLKVETIVLRLGKEINSGRR